MAWAAAGNLALALAGLLAALAFVDLGLTARRGTAWPRGRWLLKGSTLALGVGALLLASRLLVLDGRIAYVRAQVDATVPLLYRLTALWAGQEGSLLFWAFLAALLAVALQDRLAREACLSPQNRAIVVAPFALGVAAFAFLALGAASPFSLADPAAPWRGLPLVLQTPEMVLHPPLLYLGYLLSGVPYTAYLASMVPVTGPAARRILRSTARTGARRAWIALSLGIILGARWAYLELGWGGYWAWDPVENAALLPWLLLTAYLHIAPPKPIRPAWEVGLGVAAFPLALLGVWITRTGSLDSIHAFADPGLGGWLAGLVGLAAAVPAVLWARGERPRPANAPWGWREAVVLILLAATLVVGVGTFLPWLSLLLAKTRLEANAAFYTRALAPLVLALLVLLGVARQWARSWRGVATHLAVVLVAIGLAGGLAQSEIRLVLEPGTSAVAGDLQVTLEALTEERSPTRTTVAAQARFDRTGGDGGFTLTSAKVFTPGESQPYTVVAIAHRAWGDLKLVLAGWEPGGRAASLVVTRHPLVGCLWLGGLLMVGGALDYSTLRRRWSHGAVHRH